VRQPGQALLELRGHRAAVNAVEWSPSRRGLLASGADDALVLVWDLINANNGAALTGVDGNGVHVSASGAVGSTGVPAASSSAAPAAPAAGAGAAGAAGASGAAAHPVGAKGPASWWRCDYEVGNLSWAPPGAGGLGQGGGDWLGVSGGRGVWGVRL
jgi:DDB1- and CUL4-associated factor 7